jgi:hypothetical protein
MMTRAVLLTAVVSFASAFAADWKPFDGGEYTVNFPGAPKTSQREDETQIGKVVSTVAAVELEHEAFTVSVTVYPPDLVKKSVPAKMLEGARDGAVANVAGTLDKDFGVFLDSGEAKKKWPGREFTLHTTQGMAMTSRVYLVNNKLYTLLLVRDSTVKDDSEFEKFADSLKLKVAAPEKSEKAEKPAKKK